MRKLILLVLVSSCWATTTVTGHVSTLGTTAVTSSTFVRFWLRGCGGNQPRINGTSVIAPSQGGSYFFDFPVNSSGNISGTLYSTRDGAGTGNGEIECGGSQTSVWYGMQVFNSGKGGSETPVHAKSGGSLDVSNVTPITTSPVTNSPTGDTTYARIDGGNSPFTGPVQMNNNFTALAGQNSAKAYNLNNVLFVDGNKYPCTAAGTIALLAASTGLANAQGCLSGFTTASELDIAAGISFLHPPNSTWTFSGTTPAQYGVKLATGALFSGGSSAASDSTAFTLQASASASLDSLLATDPSVVGGGYFAAENLKLYNPSGGTFANGLLHAENMVDGSFFRNTVVASYNGVGINWRKNCCAAYGLGLVTNGNYGANALPFWLNSDITHNNVANYFFASSIDHPGAGKNNLLLTGLNHYWCNGNAFYGLYMEGANGNGDTTTPAIDVNCFGGTSFYDVDMANDDPASTRYVLQIETSVGGVNALNVEAGISTNIINDIANGITVTTTPGPFPGYQPINYMSIPTWMPFLHIGGTSGGPGGIFNRNLLFSANVPTLGAGFGTSPSIPTNNGDTVFSINVGTGGTATTGTINFNATAANRWIVHCQDRTTLSTTVFTTRQTASTTTSATVGNFNTSAAAAAWAASDILDCIAAAE